MLCVPVQNNLYNMDDALTDSMTSVWFAALLEPSGYHLLPFDAPLLSSIVQTPNHRIVCVDHGFQRWRFYEFVKFNLL